MTARRKLQEDKKIQFERSEFFQEKSPESLKVMIESIDEAFRTCSPFLEPVLLSAWQYNSKRCQDIVLKSCKKVLKAPIIKEEYEWFTQYVFPSSVWMLKANDGYMYDELLAIASDMSTNIIASMDSIYDHLKSHPKWNELMDIKNQTVVSRQDHKKVRLLQEKGITDIVDVKDDKADDMETFIDSNVAVTKLITTAKNINTEFQDHVKLAMSHYGNVAGGPVKKVDRCKSKLGMSVSCVKNNVE